MLEAFGIHPAIRDERVSGTTIDVAFRGELRPEQKAAADALMAHDIGVLAATTAFGKTVVAAWLIAQRGVNTLILVHRRQLLDQWIERLSTFLGLPRKSIGRIGGGRNAPTGILIPVTWVTDYTEHIGNTFGPKGFSIGSSRPASSSK